MDGKEFQDLKVFGNYIEKKPTNNPVKKIKINQNIPKQIKPNAKYDLKKIFILFKKKTIFYSNKFLKIIKTIFHAVRRKIVDFNYMVSLFKKRRDLISKNKSMRAKKGYKIVETCKYRKNKTIIVRKRVFNQLELIQVQPKKAGMPALFYLTLNEEDQEKTEPEAYIRSKKSAWDFPVDYKEK